ncbi:MAG TPA: hypothetical protein VGR08_01215, partial [Thermomicrobiales bacterium]|nr:hypothetical protein [Thermomicrobiales bacterium]
MTDTSARSAARLTGTETGTDTVTDIDQEQDQEQGRDPRDGQPAPDVTRSAMAVSGRPLDATDTLFRSRVTIPQTPEASPDGQWIAFLLDDADGQPRLWLSPVDGGDAQAVSLPFEPVIDRDPDTGRTIRGPQWSPDGTTIALAGRQSAGEPVAIWLVPSPGSGASGDDVASGAAASGESEGGDEPASTGDGAESSRVAAAAEAEVDAQSGADPDEGTSADGTGTEGTDADQVASRTSLADADQVVADAGAATSANGTADDPVSFVELGQKAAPRQVRRLTNGTAPERSPRWSPNGETIAFVQTRDRRDVIALASPNSEGPARIELLSWSGQDDREPAWSRDGKFLAFTRQRPDGPEHADIYVYTVATSELKNLTTDKASAIRHSLDWVPGRNLVGYVTREIDWLSISVINADNKAGWTVTRETGDKTDVRFAPKEARMLYIRTEGFATVCCERGLHASGSVALDPGEGTVYSLRW